ncbi:putative zinc ZIP transporter protein [Cryptosporidium canis]|uniref:Zinc ZIP transporter protein n=1 Tax=Cryptosporidium canis TaxID=195482 RepID=A0A9D5HVY2_9CRYT|nr:putative zinc ZIP transporter protein [Cryptosporidium canis]
MNQLIWSKILSFISVILVGCIGVYIPIYIGHLNPIFLQYINVFAGGTLLTLSLCHLIPEAEEIVRANNISLSLLGTEIPIVAYLTLLGLTIILFFEKALFSPQDVSQFHMHDHSFPHKRDHHHHHHKDPGCVGVNNSSRISISTGDKSRSHLDAHSHKSNHTHYGGEIPETKVTISVASQSCDAMSYIVPSDELESNNIGTDTPLISSSVLPSEESLNIHKHHDHHTSLTFNPDLKTQNGGPNSSLNVYFLVSALSVHAIFEGMLVGISKSPISVMTITLVILAHKWVEGIAVSAGIKKHPEISQPLINQLLVSFILMSPLGIIIGQVFSFINSPILNVVFTCISSGALLYVALGEMVLDEFNCGENRKQKFILFLTGILLVSVINVAQHKLGGCTLHNHHHHHGH